MELEAGRGDQRYVVLIVSGAEAAARAIEQVRDTAESLLHEETLGMPQRLGPEFEGMEDEGE